MLLPRPRRLGSALSLSPALRTTFALAATLSLGVACGDDKSAGEAESSGTESSDGTASGEAGEAGEVGTDSSTDTATGESETGEPAGPDPAVGFDIARVTTNQGTLVDIAAGADWVDGSNRRTVIVSNRDTLVQVHHTLAAGWQARELEARLHLFDAEGNPVKTLTERKMITSDSQELDLNSGFFFGLVAEDGETAPGMQFQVEVVEVGEAPAGLPEGVHTSPATPNFVGFEQDPMEMKIVFVPVTYNGSTPTLSDADKSFLENHIFEHNPLQSIEITYHEPISYDQEITDLGQLLGPMSDLRAEEGNQFSNIYYAALCRVPYPGGVAGIAQVASAAISSERISANVWYSTDDSDTVVHEIGHNQGLSHVACPGGNSAGNDPAYPDPDGNIQVYGFGIKTFELHPANEKDYMSYCGPSWVSDWTWSKTFFRVLALTQWDYDYVVPPEATTLLKGVVLRDGSTHWWTGPGVMEPDLVSGNHRLRFELEGQVVEELGQVQPLSEGGGFWVQAPLPADLEELGAIEYIGETARATVELER